ncbi:unnamed protein product, partial [Ectocarpus sp. 8 AP-2014]
GQDQEERTIALSVPRGGPQARMVQVPHGIKLGPRRETPPPASPRVGTGSDTLSLAPFQPHDQNEGESTPKIYPREDTPDPCAAGMLSKAPPREADATPRSISVPRVRPTSPAPVSASTAVVPVTAVKDLSAVAASPWLSGPCFSPSSPFCEKSPQSVGYRKETTTPAAHGRARARPSGLGGDDSG